MRVVQINANYDYTSTGRIVKDIHKKLLADGHESFVFCTVNDSNDPNVNIVGNKLDWKIHALLSRLTGLQGYYSLLSTKALVRKLRAINPDVIHLHNIHANYINLNILFNYIKKSNITVCITLHDCWYYTGRCCHYINDNCNRWLTNCGSCPSLKKWNKSWFFDRSKKMLSDKRKWLGSLPVLKVIGVSDWILNEAKKSFLKENASFFRIYNWIDNELYLPEFCSSNKKDIISVSSLWNEEKGLKDIINIAQKRPKYNFKVIGRVMYEGVLPSNIEVIGLVKDPKMMSVYYKESAVLLHLSIQETFGKVVAEAMACGTPAIVYDTTALPELVNNVHGWVIHKGDVEGVLKALDEAILNKNEQQYKQCRAYVLDAFNKDILLSQQIQLYEN